jgi:hypothetical protein
MSRALLRELFADDGPVVAPAPVAWLNRPVFRTLPKRLPGESQSDYLRRRKAPHVVELSETNAKIEIGGFDALDSARPTLVKGDPTSLPYWERVCPSLYAEHFILLLGLRLLSWTKEPSDDGFSTSPEEAYFVYSGGGELGGPAERRQSFIDLFHDLERCWIRITDGSGNTRALKLLSFKVVKTQMAKAFAGSNIDQKCCLFSDIRIAKEYLDAVEGTDAVSIRYDTLAKLNSSAAKAAYLYFLARCFHRHSRDDAAIISSQLLFERIGAIKVGEREKRVFRKRRLERLVNELDKLPLLYNRWRVSFEPNRTGSDFNVVGWVEEVDDKELRKVTEEESKLYQAWISAGKPKSDYFLRISKIKDLNDYERDLLNAAGISDLKKSYVFFKKAKALLGEEDFDTVVAGAKAALLERGAKRLTLGPEPYLIGALMNEVRSR